MNISSNIVIVMLRRPKLNSPGEMRSDPFWEFGSFGCTRCHHRNLLNPRRAKELEGVRLAFVQGGPSGIKLVHLTPPVTVIHHSDRCELKWSPNEMPLKYSAAPTIIDNDGSSDTPALLREIMDVVRSKPVGKFASKFRSRRKPINIKFAHELKVAYRKYRRRSGAVAKRYEEALPFPPPTIDRRRNKTYRDLVSKIGLLSATRGSDAARMPKRFSRC